MIVFTKFEVGDIVSLNGVKDRRWQVTKLDQFEARVEWEHMSERWAGDIPIDESKCELWKPE